MKQLSAHTLPRTMRGLALREGGVELVERPVPAPGPGQVLVRMHASPINPNDLMLIDKTYEVKKPIGTVAGFEGSGTVVASGGGAMGRFLLGREVACAAGDGDGTWAEYACVDAMRCAPLPKGTDPQQGAMLLTNPMTATVLVQNGRRAGHRAFVQNAAAGALGKMIVRTCSREGLALVNVVRRADQADALRAIGAAHVVVSTAPDADAELGALCERLDVRYGFDAIAGKGTDQLARAIGVDGHVVVYGMLSGAPCEIDAHTLVFRQIRIEGFTMYAWLERTSLLGKLRTVRKAQRRLGDDLRTDVSATHGLAAHHDALARARGAASDGKVMFVLDA